MIREELVEDEEVVILDLVLDLLSVFVDVDASVLEHSVLHLNMVKQTILGVKIVEKRMLIDDWGPLTWNVAVILLSSARAGETNDALPTQDKVHARWYFTLTRQELSILELDDSEVLGNRPEDISLDVSEDGELLQEAEPLVQLIGHVIFRFRLLDAHYRVLLGGLERRLIIIFLYGHSLQ